ncbi:hypothetical protein BaRGS_00031621 [Batillaria attramentaria]|uniref:UDP-glucose:glycoprotein glucosyltransferase n=1 Tax=Batillaria attramentaria TaxID=370345 RepID=A0ABD0JR20_9CAEN
MQAIVWLLVLSLSLCWLAEGRQKPVTVKLDAKWSSTPLLLEASEYLAKESNDYFWSFVRDLMQQKQPVAETEQGVYNIALQLAAKHISPLQLNLLKLGLSLRAFSPTVQTHQQIAQEYPVSEECSAFVEVRGELSCDPQKLDNLLPGDGTNSPVLKFDHVYPGAVSSSPVVILYGQLGTPEFLAFHQILAEKAAQREIQYVLRHFIQKPSEKPVRLSGYGVELAIKSTEYKAKDDTKVEGGAEGENVDLEEEGEDLQGFVFSKLRELHPELSKDLTEFRGHLLDSATELAPLKVWQMQEALQHLVDISQNFPGVVRTLIKTPVSQELKKEIRKNQEIFERKTGLAAGDSAMFLNGRTVDMDIYDMFTLLDIMNEEAKLVEGLHSLGFKGDKLQSLLQLDLSGGEDASYALDIRHSAMQYVNDLEKDSKYRGWPSSVQDMLRPTFPGMLRHVAKNIFHLVFVVNPADDASRELLKVAEAFYVHNAPLRVGLVLAVNSDRAVTGNDDAGVAFARTFDFIKSDQSPAKALSFITDVYEKVGSGEITADSIIAEFSAQYPGEDRDMVFGSSSDYDDSRKAAADFLAKSGLSGFPQVLLNGVPIDKKYLTQDSFEEGVVMEIMKQTQVIQKAVYNGDLTDRVDVLEWLMEQEHIMPRLNSRVLSPPARHLDLTENMDGSSFDEPETFELLNTREMSAVVADRMKYLTKRDEAAVRPVSLWVICDLETEGGRDIMYNAIKQVKTSNEMRLGIVFNPVSPDKPGLVSRAVQVALQWLPNMLAKSFITKLVKEENYAELAAGTKTLRDFEVNGMDMDAFLRELEQEKGNFLRSHAIYATRAFAFSPGQQGLVINGKVYGPLDAGETFMQDDFSLIEKLVTVKSGSKIRKEVQAIGMVGDKGSEKVMKVSALLTSRSSSTARHKVVFSGDSHSVVKLPASEDLPAFTVEAIVDPASREAQKMAPILMILQEVANVDIRIYMNSRTQLSEMPVKRFYRYVLEPELTFRGNGMLSDGPVARFLDLPHKSLLTLGMEPPESWLVESVASVYDLDNILLEEVDKAVNAGFELEYLLLEGHCSDASTMQPPRGLQFILGTETQPAVVDTIVMANLGYFQLKASPGVWKLQLREGRSRDVYDIQSHEYTDTPDNFTDVVVAMTSFKSKIIRIKVAKKPDKLQEKLLQDGDDESGGLWDSISRYKILFLDVLFPLDVKKIIFVDADQIVRTDLQELVDLDLGGAPYGYTPFCDSRKEMDGFRFWKSGYWHSHLAGRKYHISALYVVDLKKFRQIAAGDRLRGQYQGLSQDPNSLANLDQDLPNNMIHQVAIKSLPQEWLYCETWCSDAEKARAKTIDLCNNPMTKEPKLQAAMRIVPEWKNYDYEIKVLWDKVYNTNTRDQIEYERPDIPIPDFKVKTEL